MERSEPREALLNAALGQLDGAHGRPGREITREPESPAVPALAAAKAPAPHGSRCVEHLAAGAGHQSIVRRLTEIRNRDGTPLSAVVTLPASLKGRPRVVVFCQAGLQNKSGVGDYFRWLGDQLAAEGLAVIRFDQAGTGDSPGALEREMTTPELFRLIQAGCFVADTEDVIDWVRQVLQPAKLYLWGQCGGCISATLACASRQDSVAGLVLLALPVLYTPLSPELRDLDARVLRREYRAKLVDIDAWRRLLSGRSEYRLILAAMKLRLRQLQQAARRALPRAPRDHAPDHPQFNWLFWQAFQAVMSAAKPVLILMPEIDNETPEFDRELRYKVLERREEYMRLATIRYLAQADHSMMFEEPRLESRDLIRDWLARQAPARATALRT